MSVVYDKLLNMKFSAVKIQVAKNSKSYNLVSYPEMPTTKESTRNTLTSIKVTVLPLNYAVYPWSKHCECALVQILATDV